MKSPEEKLAIIDASEVELKLSKTGRKTLYIAKLPYVREFTAEHEPRDEAAFLNEIRVPRGLRRHGIATRLLGKLGPHLVEHEIDRMTTYADSPYTIRALRSAFGEQAISLYTMSEEELDMTLEQAIDLLSQNTVSDTRHQISIDVDLPRTSTKTE